MPAASTAHPRSRPLTRAPAKARNGRRSGPSRRAGTGVRWDRVGRIAMLCVLAALLYLYLSAGIHMFSTWRQSSHARATVSSMESEHRSLVKQHQMLSQLATVEAEARRLGMMRPGEQPYVMSGLPKN
ncbi:MAG: Septum formation initiator [Solirubrobacterales bacterium]|nr:Septum formation initiator [Solirubrobacterales bacterium]